MKPEDFRQSNCNLTAPAGMEKTCGVLPVFRDGQHVISCWRLSWRERLKLLVTGRLWLWVVSARTQPPVHLETDTPWPAKRRRFRIAWRNHRPRFEVP